MGKRCAITPIIARRTGVRKAAVLGPFSDCRRAENRPRRRVGLSPARREHSAPLRDHVHSSAAAQR